MLDNVGHLEPIFYYFFYINYYLVYFKEFIVFLYCKQGDMKNFTYPKSYLPINLLNMVKTIMGAMPAAKISYIITIHNFVAKIHFKSQYKLYMQTTIYHLLNKIHTTKNKNKIASLFITSVYMAFFIIFSIACFPAYA